MAVLGRVRWALIGRAVFHFFPRVFESPTSSASNRNFHTPSHTQTIDKNTVEKKLQRWMSHRTETTNPGR